MLVIRLSEQLERRLDELAKRTGRTKAFHACEAIAAYIDEQEDIHLADKEVQRIEDGRSKASSLEEVMREHGLKD